MEPEKQNQDLKSQILTRIEEESMSPHSRWIYSGRECAVWTLWFATAIFGAVAVAVSLFVVMQRQFSFYEATHESFWSFAVEVLPYLWISIFIIMILFAVFNLRHTKTGYRYPLWQIFGSSLVLSLAGGTILHLSGAGFALDHQMGMFSPHYMSQEKIEEKLWQKPEQGRLVGTLLTINNGEATTTYIFQDINGIHYETNVSELQKVDTELLGSGKRVRVIGKMLPSTPPQFYACDVFPWVYEYEHTMKELGEMRREMRERVARHRKQFADFASSTLVKKDEVSDNCADMEILKRINFSPAY